MTYRDALIHSISALIFLLAGCSTVDDPGGHETAAEDPDPEDMEPDEPEPLPDPEPDPDPEPACAESQLELALGEPAPSGIAAKEIVGRSQALTGAKLTLFGFDDEVTGLEIAIHYLDEPFTVLDADGAQAGCEPWTLFQIPVQVLLQSDDGRFDDLLDATLIHHSSDPESVELRLDRVDFADLGGNFEPPKLIGPEAIARDLFSAFSLDMRVVIGDPRPMAAAGEEVLDGVQGIILGSGELADVDCPEGQDEGACDGAVEFLLGSLELDGI
ncbi:MAG: hypothetical protein R3A79_26560 [Nannocystaceae bacterium]